MKGLDIELKVITEETIIFQITGDINIYNANDLRREFDRHMVKGAKNFILDFGQMTMIDSAGIGVLFTMLNRVKHMPGKVMIVRASKHVIKLFEITRVSKFFHLLDTVDAAVRETLVPSTPA